MTKIHFVATGSTLIKGKIRAFESIIEELIINANKEIYIVSYLITTSAIRIISLIEIALMKGIKVVIVFNEENMLDETIKEKLNYLKNNFPKTFKAISFKEITGKNLHAKIIIVDRKKAVIGSANLSWGGMKANYEIGVFMEGDMVWDLVSLIDSLIVS